MELVEFEPQVTRRLLKMDIDDVGRDDDGGNFDTSSSTDRMSVSDYWPFVSGIVQQYGWFVLLGFVCLLYFRKSIQEKLHKITKEKDDLKYAKKYDAGLAHQRQLAMAVARQKAQEEHDIAAQKWREKQEELQEKKRLEKIEDWEKHQQGLGYRSKTKVPEESSGASSSSEPKPKNKKTLRSDDSLPLGGASGSSCRMDFRRGRGGGGG